VAELAWRTKGDDDSSGVGTDLSSACSSSVKRLDAVVSLHLLLAAAAANVFRRPDAVHQLSLFCDTFGGGWRWWWDLLNCRFCLLIFRFLIVMLLFLSSKTPSSLAPVAERFRVPSIFV
jgi:hypothetical protein